MAKKQTKQGKSNPKYTPEFIKKSLASWAKLRAEGKTTAQCGKAIGVHPSMLYFWKARSEGRPWGSEDKARHAAKLDAAVAKLDGPPPARPRSLVARARPGAAAHQS